MSEIGPDVEWVDDFGGVPAQPRRAVPVVPEVIDEDDPTVEVIPGTLANGGVRARARRGPDVDAAALEGTGPAPLATAQDVLDGSGLASAPDAVVAALSVQLASLQASLAAMLHRPLQPTSITETITVGLDQQLPLAASPVVSVDALAIGDPFGGFSSVALVGTALGVLSLPWRPGTVVQITYTAGLDPVRYGPLLKAALVAKAAQFLGVLLARTQVSALSGDPGAGLPVPGPQAGIKSFSVEGLSVAYLTSDEAVVNAARAAAAVTSVSAWSPAEIAAFGLGTVRRPVVA